MSDESDQQKKETPIADKSVYLNRLTLTANVKAEKKPQLYWTVFRGFPRIEVRTNDPGDNEKNYGKITAPVDLPRAMVIADLIEKACKMQPGEKEVIYNKSTYLDGKKFEQPTHINSIVIGKDNDGLVYISVIQKDRPRIKFTFDYSEWHHIVDKDGNPIDKGEQSQAFARGYAQAIRTLLGATVAIGEVGKVWPDMFYASKEAAQAATGNSGGYNRGGGNRGGYNKGGGYSGYNKGGYNKGNYNKGGGDYNRGNYNNRNQGNDNGGYDEEDVPF